MLESVSLATYSVNPGRGLFQVGVIALFLGRELRAVEVDLFRPFIVDPKELRLHFILFVTVQPVLGQ